MARNVALWSEQDWTHDRIERYFRRQNFRMSAGVWLQPDQALLVGAIAIWQGRGKYIGLKHVEFAELSLLDGLTNSLAKLFSNENPHLNEWQSVASDLVEHQAVLIGQLQRKAGKFVDRIVAVALDGPPLIRRDFDGRVEHLGYFDPVKLAEKTGANIVDAISERDIAAGGNGEALHALPCWLLFSEREKKEHCGSLLILRREQMELLWLPASDGADDVVPEVRLGRIDSSQSLSHQIEGFLKSVSPTSHVDEAILLGFSDADIEKWNSSLVGDVSLIGEIVIRPDIPSVANLDALVAAMWGILFADQMPGNLPDLTGASSQRVLGRIAPGRPFAWRTLVQNMSDGTAPTMRLRDVI